MSRTGHDPPHAKLKNCLGESPDLIRLPTLQEMRPCDSRAASGLALSPGRRADILNVATQPPMCRIGILHDKAALHPWITTLIWHKEYSG